MKDRIEATYRPVLESLAIDLAQKHPAIQFHVSSRAIGSLTEHQGWHLSIVAVSAGSGPHESDPVELSIELCHLDRQPRVMAAVFWGEPSGNCEATVWDW